MTTSQQRAPRCRIELDTGALVWKTDAHLEVTAISASLGQLAGLEDFHRRIHLSDVWTHDGRSGETVAAHRQALEGKAVRFESRIGDRLFRFELTPICDRDRKVVGVAGKAEAL